MAERRMFAKSIVLSDAFLDMPLSARCLYFTLGMLADDDGFVGSPKAIMRQCGASQDDMLALIQKRYVLAFDSGVIVIKHWRINNYLRSDRYNETTYLEEKDTLSLDQKGAYTESEKAVGIPVGIPLVDTGKVSIGKDSINNNTNNTNTNTNNKFVPPKVEEVKAYCEERKNGIDPEMFISFYESKGWMIGKNKMKDWKAAVRTWEKKERANKADKSDNKPKGKMRDFEQRSYNFADLENEVFGN